MTKALKNKLQKDNINIGKNEIMLVENFFYFEDVKSALQGLINEVKREIKKIETDEKYAQEEDNRLFIKMGKDIGYEGALAYLKQNILEEFLIKVKKWFPDVVKDD